MSKYYYMVYFEVTEASEGFSFNGNPLTEGAFTFYFTLDTNQTSSKTIMGMFTGAGLVMNLEFKQLHEPKDLITP